MVARRAPSPNHPATTTRRYSRRRISHGLNQLWVKKSFFDETSISASVTTGAVTRLQLVPLRLNYTKFHRDLSRGPRFDSRVLCNRSGRKTAPRNNTSPLCGAALRETQSLAGVSSQKIRAFVKAENILFLNVLTCTGFRPLRAGCAATRRRLSGWN
jgi:hypothetical protein